MTVEIASGYLAQALYASLFRVICGFAIAVAVGVALGATMARIRLVSDLFGPLVELVRRSRRWHSSRSPFCGSVSATRRRSSSSPWRHRTLLARLGLFARARGSLVGAVAVLLHELAGASGSPKTATVRGFPPGPSGSIRVGMRAVGLIFK